MNVASRQAFSGLHGNPHAQKTIQEVGSSLAAKG